MTKPKHPPGPAEDSRQQKIIIKGPCVSVNSDPHHRYPRSTFALAMMH
jgi:hypothetical protein